MSEPKLEAPDETVFMNISGDDNDREVASQTFVSPSGIDLTFEGYAAANSNAITSVEVLNGELVIPLNNEFNRCSGLSLIGAINSLSIGICSA
jgi:hypothetical protein